MKMMNRNFCKLTFLIAMMFLATPAWCAVTASDIVKNAVEKIKKSASWNASYKISAGGDSSKGQLTVCGSMFKIDSPEMKVWFDGKTQWTYLVDEGEIDITEPTKGEVQQVNPFAILNSCSKDFNCSMVRSAVQGKNVVTLTPKDKKKAEGISSVKATFNATTSLPEQLAVSMSSKNVVVIDINSLTPGKALAKSAFQPSSSLLKSVEVVDLR